jgi:hypothetical protein
MKPHPRIRKMIKWGGAAVTVLLVVVWIGSAWVGLTLLFGATAVRVESCRLETGHVGGPDLADSSGVHLQWRMMGYATGIRWLKDHETVDWAFRWDDFGPPGQELRALYIPLWALVALALFATVLAWRLDTLARRRARLNLCPKCNYDRAGIAVGARCPECGAAPMDG